ncbi:ABC transporter substrate-binding protein [Nesterenkonia sp. NBAIMH1]|uniref:ABC transporter substrate-binding protein n=1 Tax=Nesterenkonia sp. NBAIMH1 TaxID=2600320 RepID=UPI00143D5454|nr:extracellular solute-binding protein [Nesterenkonia sp. NBAIMH1]
MKTPRIAIPTISVAALVLTGCGGGDADEAEAADQGGGDHSEEVQALVDEAQDAGAVTFYSMIDESALRTIAEEFTEEYGVEVRPVRLVTGDLTQRYSAEADSGSAVADLILMTQSPFFAEALDNEWLTPVDELDMPEMADELPEEFWDDEGATPIASLIPTDAVINTEEVSAPLEQWEDYADPEFAGSLLLAEPDSSPANASFWGLMRQEFGDEFLEGVADNDPTWLDSAVPVTQAVAAGEGQIGHPGVSAIVNNLIEQGAPVEIVEMSPTTGPEAAIGISNDSPNQAGAQLLAAYLMGEEGSTLLNDVTDAISPYDDEGMDRFTRTSEIEDPDTDEINSLLGLN